jgi:hypothetical protein
VRGAASWVVLALLGAFHGANPAMGWLFAVARGLQERSRAAVMGSLLPLAGGHALAIAVVVALFGVLGSVVGPGALRLSSGAVLIGFGAFKLAKPLAHPRWVGMRVGGGQLTLWSFLMASAHGAGLMLVPAFGGIAALTAVRADPHVAAAGLALTSASVAGAAVAVHTAAMLAVTALVAVVVFDHVGVAFLRKAWFNIDLLWAAALVLSGVWVLVAGVV